MLLTICILLAILSGWLVYSVLDTSVTVDHAHQQMKYQKETIRVLADLLRSTAVHHSRAEILKIAKALPGTDHIIKENPDSIEVDAVIFKFKGESLVGIELMN